MFRGAVDAAFLATARERLATLPDTGALRTGPLDRFTDLVAAPSLVTIARHALGGDVDAFGCTFVVKPPRTGLPARWHQDGHPWEGRGIARALTIGVALDETTEANGCLRVIPGSHRLAAQPLRPATEPPNVFGAEIDPALVDEALAVSVPLEPGDACAHLPTLIHGSGPNRSDSRRVTLVIRYRA